MNIGLLTVGLISSILAMVHWYCCIRKLFKDPEEVEEGEEGGDMMTQSNFWSFPKIRIPGTNPVVAGLSGLWLHNNNSLTDSTSAQLWPNSLHRYYLRHQPVVSSTVEKKTFTILKKKIPFKTSIVCKELKEVTKVNKEDHEEATNTEEETNLHHLSTTQRRF